MVKRIASLILFELIVLACVICGYAYWENPFQNNIQAMINTQQGTVGLMQGRWNQYLFYDKAEFANLKIIQEDNLIKDYVAIDMDTENDSIYLLLRKVDNSSDYAFAEYNTNLQLTNLYLGQGLDDNKVKAISSVMGKFYISSIVENGKKALVYSIDTSEEAANNNQNTMLYDQFLVENDQRIVDVDYDGQQVLVCYDVDSLEQKYDIHGFDMSAKYSKSHIWYELILQNIIYLMIISIFVWGLLATIIHMLFGSKSYGLQKFALIEATIMIIMIIGCVMIGANTVKTAKTIKEENVSLLLQSLQSKLGKFLINADDEENLIYNELFDEVVAFEDEMQDTGFIDSICLVNLTKDRYQIEVSPEYPRNYSVDLVFGKKASEAFASAKKDAKDTFTEALIDGREYGVVIKVWDSEPIPKHFLVALAPLDQIRFETRDSLILIMIACFVLFVIGTIMNIIITLIETHEIRGFSKAIEKISRGNTINFEKSHNRNWDMKVMWDSLFEISKDREKIFYSRDRVFQSYYRFAPRNIEKILGAETISDIKIGDMVDVNATLGIISNKENKTTNYKDFIECINNNYEIICKHQIKNNGVLIPNGSKFRSMNVLFTENKSNEKAVRFAIDAMIELAESKSFEKQKMSILINKQNISYGVAGSKEQAFPFIFSNEMDELVSIGQQFMEMGIRLVVTKDVADTLSENIEKRYIGYIYIKSMDKRIDCYEILDAYPIQEKDSRKRASGYFEKGLKLFYKNDYYLARNEFVEGFKLCEHDELTLWYIFQCEKLLGAMNAGEVRHNLFEEV